MSYSWAPYDPAYDCTPSSAGAKALAAYLEDAFPYQRSMGICNCRPVRGGKALSHHSQCRAYDCGIPTGPGGSYRPELGDPIVELLGPHGRRLGLDHLILNRRIYSAKSPNGRYYGGAHPHYDHAHIGLTRLGGANLNYATLVSVLGEPGDVTQPGGDQEMNQLKKGDRGHAVSYYQKAINDWGHTPPLVVDGIFGPATEAGVKAYQTAADLDPTGVIDGVLGHLLGRYHA